MKSNLLKHLTLYENTIVMKVLFQQFILNLFCLQTIQTLLDIMVVFLRYKIRYIGIVLDAYATSVLEYRASVGRIRGGVRWSTRHGETIISWDLDERRLDIEVGLRLKASVTEGGSVERSCSLCCYVQP